MDSDSSEPRHDSAYRLGVFIAWVLAGGLCWLVVLGLYVITQNVFQYCP